jgi:hypothetical protein
MKLSNPLRHGTDVEFVREYSQERTEPVTGQTGILHYRIYRAKTADQARKFLDEQTVTERLHYVVVETPEGNWGRDVNGLYKE